MIANGFVFGENNRRHDYGIGDSVGWLGDRAWAGSRFPGQPPPVAGLVRL
jgi:hypothetical protein